MGNRNLDWLRQAEADYRHGVHCLRDGDFEWCCFSAQQSAEKAVKAVFLKLGMDAWGHTVSALLGQLPTELSVSNELMDSAKVLDKHYIPSRYPSGFDSGAPTDFYTRGEGEAALACAERLIEYCRHQIRGS